MVSLTALVNTQALYLLSALFLMGAQSRFTSLLTPRLHTAANASTARTRDTELVRPLLHLSPYTHQRVVGAFMGLLGIGMLVPSVRKPSLFAGLAMNLWGFVNRWRAELDIWKFSAAWVVLIDALVVLGTMP